MTRPDARRVLRAAALAAIAASLNLLAPPPARAQLGGLIKKATDKATEQATGQEAGAAARPIGTELTDDILARMIKGLKVTESKLVERDRLAERQAAISNQESELSSRESATIAGYQDVHERWERCQSDQFGKLTREHSKAVETASKAMMNDPAKMQAYMQAQQKLGMEYAIAMRSNDTAAIRKARENLQNVATSFSGTDFKAKAKGQLTTTELQRLRAREGEIAQFKRAL